MSSCMRSGLVKARPPGADGCSNLQRSGGQGQAECASERSQHRSDSHKREASGGDLFGAGRFRRCAAGHRNHHAQPYSQEWPAPSPGLTGKTGRPLWTRRASTQSLWAPAAAGWSSSLWRLEGGSARRRVSSSDSSLRPARGACLANCEVPQLPLLLDAGAACWRLALLARCRPPCWATSSSLCVLPVNRDCRSWSRLRSATRLLPCVA